TALFGNAFGSDSVTGENCDLESLHLGQKLGKEARSVNSRNPLPTGKTRRWTPANPAASTKPMRFRSFVALTLAAMAAHAADSDFNPIFNGKDLTGWEGEPKLWSAKDGVLRGETTTPQKGNTFLMWRAGTVKDFELKIKFRIQNGNSGVQYRSKDLGKFVASGYQAEIENKQGKVGFLYEEKGRKYLANVGEKVEVGPEGEQ